MDALVMCGGEGSRLRDGGVITEKPLVKVGGQPMIDRICVTLSNSQVETGYAAVSPAAPATREHASDLELSVIDTPGAGYVADLDHALKVVGRPALTVAADLPLLTPELVNRVLAVAKHVAAGHSVTVCVPVYLKRRLGVSMDTTIPPEAIDDAEVLSGSSLDTDTDDDSDVRRSRCRTTHAQARVGDTPELAPAGINVVADARNTQAGNSGSENSQVTDSENVMFVSHDVRFAVNVNRPTDLAIAEDLCD